MYGVELLNSNESADHVMTPSALECMEHLGLKGVCWIIGEDVNNDQYMEQPLVSSVLHEVGNITLSIQDIVKGFRVIVVEVDRILVCWTFISF